MNATQTPSPIAGLEPTLPTAWYRSEEAFRAEKERIFWREWMCVGREEELPAAGAHRVLDIAGESIIVVRNQEGVLRGFYWQAFALTAPGAERAPSSTIDPALALGGRDCAALHLFDCPAVLSRRGGGFEVWVEASYAVAFREVMGEILDESK